MDLWCVQARSNPFLLKNSSLEKPMIWNPRNTSTALDFRVSMKKSVSGCCKYRSIMVRAMRKKNPGNSNSSSSNSGNSDQSKAGGHGIDGKHHPAGKNKSSDNDSQNSHGKPLDWREFRALLYIQEQDSSCDIIAGRKCRFCSQPREDGSWICISSSKWAHPISAPENGCLLVATEKLDGVRTFARTVVLLLRSGTRNPQEGPFGVVINRPLLKKMKHMNPTNIELATTFSDCSLHFGGPLDASMFLIRAGETTGRPGFEEFINGVYFGSRNTLDEASGLAKKSTLKSQDFRFFVGYAGWQLDQLREEIESDYWYVAACSANMIFSGSQSSSSDVLWEEILQLMGGHYSELSGKPKQGL